MIFRALNIFAKEIIKMLLKFNYNEIEDSRTPKKQF
jgi:hypothetical protein